MQNNLNNTVGLGLRGSHFKDVIEGNYPVSWFEIHSCNYLNASRSKHYLKKIAERYPLSFHGVNLNLGGLEAIGIDYLRALKAFVDDFEPCLVSDHLCFNRFNNIAYHDLLPIPFTEEAVNHMATRIAMVQDYLQRQILVENISQYFLYPESYLDDCEFLTAVANKAQCGLLIDINNAYCNEKNGGIKVRTLIQSLPPSLIKEVHLAGHKHIENCFIDSHDCEISDEVWTLYRYACLHWGNKPTIVEWDSKLPPFSTLLNQWEQANRIQRKTQLVDLEQRASRIEYENSLR